MAPSAVNGAPHTNGVTVPIVNGHKGSYAAKYNLPAHFIGGNHLEAAAPGRVKDFVAANDGHTVITSVGLENSWTDFCKTETLTSASRSSLPTMGLPLSRRFVQYGNGRMRPSEMSEQYNSRSWLRRRIWAPMRITFGWRINTLRYHSYQLTGSTSPLA